MLVISRKKQQRVVFPDQGIEIIVVRISGNTVTLGIRAPESVPILRGELVQLELGEILSSSHERCENLMTQTAS